MNIEVEEHTTLPDTLLKRKEVDYEYGIIETPRKANRVDALGEGERIHETARGVNEAYLEFSASELEDIDPQSVTPGGKLIEEVLENAREGEFTFPVVQYTGRSRLDEDQAAELVQFLTDNFGIVTVPLKSKQLDEPNLEQNPGPVNRHLESIDRILKVAESSSMDPAIFGTVPAVPWNFIQDYLEVYMGSVDGFCIDFLGKKATAKARVRGIISNLMNHLGEHQLHRKSLLYGVNAYRGANRGDGPKSPAEDLLSVGIGIDILGGIYYSARSGWSDDKTEVNDVRIFHTESWQHEYVDAPDVPSEISSRSAFDPVEIQKQVKRGEEDRLEFLYESEQMNLAFADLREAIDDEGGTDFVRSKQGVTDNIKSRMEEARSAYDQGTSNPAVSSF